MQIIDDIKSLYNQIKKTDLHDQIAFNELGYGRRVADRIYAFCPFCGQVLELNGDQVEEVNGRLRLKDPVSCSCRKGLRYLRKGCLGLLEEEERKRISRQKKQVIQFEKTEKKKIPEDLDYDDVQSLRLEARQKLKEFRPANIGQAGRIAGVSPADVSVLLVYLKKRKS